MAKATERSRARKYNPPVISPDPTLKRNAHLTIIPRARVGYNLLISNKREWNNCFIKNNQEILLDLADFALQKQPEDNFMATISRTWYKAELLNSHF